MASRWPAVGAIGALAIGLSLLIRLAWVTAEVIHGAGHTLLRVLVDRDPAAWTLDNLLEHRAPRRMAMALLPLAPIGLPGGQPLPVPWLHVGERDPWKVRLKAGGGIALQLLAILLASTTLWQLHPAGQAFTAPSPAPMEAAAATLLQHLLLSLIVANGAMVLASRSDLRTMRSGEGPYLYCGNFGFIAAGDVPAEGDLLSPQAIERFQRMGRETELRGAQAGGGLVLTLDRLGQNRFVGHRMVNAKRGELTRALETGFRRQRRRARRSGFHPHPAGLMASWHYRFGTSGPPAVRETHWHEWSPARHCRRWTLEAGRWQGHRQTIQHRITHNGDFEALHLNGADIDITTLGRWLELALDRAAPAVVDSARIAGMMDLLICQGDWFAAVRWAFLRALAAFPQTPSAAALQQWAGQFEAAFTDELRDQAERPVLPDGVWTHRLTERILETVAEDPLLRSHGPGALRSWIRTAIEAFLHNDLQRAMQEFMERARGSFGLVVVSTPWPDRIVLSSLGQPITIGMDPAARLAVYASEAAAVDAVLAPVAGAWRIDLDQNAGEIAVVSSDDLRITSMTLERDLTRAETLRRRLSYGRPVGAGTPPAPATGAHAPDPVAADIAEIPALLSWIRNDWIDPGSPNRQSAEAMAQLLIAKAAHVAGKEDRLRQMGLDPSLAKSRHVDLLITGVENSLWLGEQFARDLSTLMPLLSVRALSANAVLNALQNDMESLAFARQSIVLVLSHSGRTFPSVQVAEACDLLVRRGVIREFFLLTGEPESLQGSPMLASRQPGEPFCRRLFITGAGRRRAEPATATVAAMHQTLTELLFSLCRQVQRAFPDERLRPLGMRLSWNERLRLEHMEDHHFLQDAQEILGADRSGERCPTETSRQLVRGGRRWAQHVLETPIAWALHSVYILISVGFGLPLFQTLALGLVPAIVPAPAWGAGSLVAGTALAADIAFYIFGPWVWTLALRWRQGRPLLARTGRRALVIGETAWIHPLLTNYVSKLFALSFGIAGLEVHGADAADHLLHTHAHRVVRGTLLFFGIPDGRCSAGQRAEANAVLLAARQSDGIRHWGTGPEIVAVGSEPSIRSGPFRLALRVPSRIHDGCDEGNASPSSDLIEAIRESRFGSFRRLLASYVFFWAMASAVGGLPLLRFKWWRSQSRTRVMTTAAPVSAARLDLAEPREISELSLNSLANREQS